MNFWPLTLAHPKPPLPNPHNLNPGDVLLGSACEVPGLEASHPLKRHVKPSPSTGRKFLDVDAEKVRILGFRVERFRLGIWAMGFIVGGQPHTQNAFLNPPR